MAAFGAVGLYGAMNFALDAIVLYMGGRLGGERVSRRLAWGALLGMAYALVPAAYDGGPLGHLLCAFLMIGAVYGYAGARRTLRRLGFLLAAAVLTGGVALAAVAAIGLAMPTAAHPMPMAGVAAAVGAVAVVERLSAAWRLRHGAGSGLDLEVELAGEHVRLRGFVDTGNRLRDPVGLAPVVVAEAAELAALMPLGVRSRYLREAAAAWTPDRLADLCPQWAPRLLLVPYATVGARGLLTAVRPDAMWALVDGGRVAVRAVVALAPSPLRCGGASAIVPASLVPAQSSQIGA